MRKKRFLKDPFPEVTSAYHHHYHEAEVVPTNHHTDFLVNIQGVAIMLRLRKPIFFLLPMSMFLTVPSTLLMTMRTSS
jgi:hypothetical protein